MSFWTDLPVNITYISQFFLSIYVRKKGEIISRLDFAMPSKLYQSCRQKSAQSSSWRKSRSSKCRSQSGASVVSSNHSSRNWPRISPPNQKRSNARVKKRQNASLKMEFWKIGSKNLKLNWKMLENSSRGIMRKVKNLTKPPKGRGQNCLKSNQMD